VTSLKRYAVAAIVGVTSVGAAAAAIGAQGSIGQPAPAPVVMPRYGSDGALLLPADYRRWVFVGSSLGLSYSAGAAGEEMFHETLIEPTAYDHFVRTGSFREGTMLALILHGVGQSILPARRGRFGAEVHVVEMAVKDSSHRPEGWAYYNFAGRQGLLSAAQAMPKESCYSCHVQHARRDNVFVQFYPMLLEAAHITLADGGVTERATVAGLALNGLDPVLFADGREELGKPEIVAEHDGYRYQFVSEPNRARFASEPARYGTKTSERANTSPK
jgi:hypothetical protein